MATSFYSVPQGKESEFREPPRTVYETWLAAGNEGTYDDFLDSLVGPPGPPGDLEEIAQAYGDPETDYTAIYTNAREGNQ